MITENQVVEYVCTYLKKNNFSILQSANVGQKGVDVIAEKDDFKIFIEAKGETSSVPNSKRFGKHFTSSQVFDVLSKVIFQALDNKNHDLWEDQSITAIAIPDTEMFRTWHSKVAESLCELQLVTLWVSEGGTVSISEEKYNYASIWMPIGGNFHEPSFNKIDFPVGETFTRIAQGFQFFADDWKEERIPFFSRTILVRFGEDIGHFNLDDVILDPILDAMRTLKKIRSISKP